ncbi:MAG: hypothetical protein P4L74_02890 [Candidatus Doudnabacteria bacterium]|nr:hypothetical protein [Candidatus Doudnabacteria bacterium]
MKYIVTIVIFLAVASPAFAAKTVRGTVPTLPPLQPPVAGVSPNFSHNIQSSGRVLPDQSGSANNPAQVQTANGSGLPQVSGSAAPSPRQGIFGSWAIFWIVILLILGGGVVAWFRRRRALL